MRIRELIELLEAHEKERGADAQIFVCDWNGDVLEEPYIHEESIATVLQCRGEPVEF